MRGLTCLSAQGNLVPIWQTGTELLACRSSRSAQVSAWKAHSSLGCILACCSLFARCTPTWRWPCRPRSQCQALLEGRARQDGSGASCVCLQALVSHEQLTPLQKPGYDRPNQQHNLYSAPLDKSWCCPSQQDAAASPCH